MTDKVTYKILLRDTWDNLHVPEETPELSSLRKNKPEVYSLWENEIRPALASGVSRTQVFSEERFKEIQKLLAYYDVYLTGWHDLTLEEKY